MNTERDALYSDLAGMIGETDLERYDGDVPNDNEIWIKRELDNPWGSHYDRVYLDLFREYEENGIIEPGDEVYETTSGSAGVSFAAIGERLGYDTTVAIPEEVPHARIDALQDQGANVIVTHDDYVNDFPSFIKQYQEDNPDSVCLNHSMGEGGTNNETTLGALETIGSEIMADVQADLFVPAVGNGSSILGPARGLDDDTSVIAFESFQSAVAYDLVRSGEYEERFDMEPGTLSFHNMPGTSYQGIPFPHIYNAVRDGYIDNVKLVSSEPMDEEFRDFVDDHDLSPSESPADLPHWEEIRKQDVGKSTRAGIAVAKDIANDVANKNIVAIGYDGAERYDDL